MAAFISGRTVRLSRDLFKRNFFLLTAGSQVQRGTGEPAAVMESEEEFHYVERLIPPSSIPPPPKHTCTTPSGWSPPSDSAPALPYLIRRSRLHNVPVYSEIKHGNQRNTLLRKVEGDIWALNEDLKDHLQQVTGRATPTQVNEVTMSIRVKGDVDKELRAWVLQHGF